MNHSKIPLVSICCQTYNHVNYIKEALEGFLMQKVNFTYEILLRDDASTDGTAKICKDYANSYPDKIKLLAYDENQWQKGVKPFSDNVKRAKGKYIALCEGDDYWTDPLKLRKQVDFLGKNPDYGLVYTYATVFIDRDNVFKANHFGKSISSMKELLMENSISTPTVLFKKQIYLRYEKEINPQNRNWLMGDYPLWLYFTSASKVKCFPYTSSVYRVLENSAVHSSDFMKELQFLESYHSIKLFFIKKFGVRNIEKAVWGRYFSNKANIYLFKNEQNISDLINEINKCDINSIKIEAIKLILANRVLRKMLKFYWSNK